MKRLSASLGIVAALILAVVAVPLAQAANPSPAELKALEIRGQALDRLCGDPDLTQTAYTHLCFTVGDGRVTPSELRALEIRGQGLNDLCDGISGEAPVAICGHLATGRAKRVAGASGFDPGDFGLGAGAMLGFGLLAGGIAAGVRYGRKGSMHPRPAS